MATSVPAPLRGEQINTWNDLISFLTHDVSWTDPERMRSELERVAAAMIQLSKFPDEIRKQMTHVAESPKLLRQYAPEMRLHRVFFDKLVLYAHPQRHFVVRVHRFRPTAWADAGDPIHAHEWPMAT